MTADHAGQTGGEREVLVCPYAAWPSGLCTDTCRMEPTCTDAPDRPVPVPGQAAREAAVDRAAIEDALVASIGPQLPPWVVWRIDPVVDAVLAALSAAPGQEQL